jgi:hypothetical protein
MAKSSVGSRQEKKRNRHNHTHRLTCTLIFLFRMLCVSTAMAAGLFTMHVSSPVAGGSEAKDSDARFCFRDSRVQGVSPVWPIVPPRICGSILLPRHSCKPPMTALS